MIARRILILIAVAIVVSWGVPAHAARYEIVTGKPSQIVFKSKAPMEKFDGKTRQVSGYFEADLARLTGEVDLDVVVDLRTFDTGKKKRNRHMRENHLETKKYPSAHFRAGRILRAEKTSVAAGATVQFVLVGSLDLHGVEKDYEVPLRITHEVDGEVTIRGSFAVSLEDHAIDRPKFLVMKLADEQQVEIELLARPVRKQ